jgi:hypothetical protein
LKKGKPVFFRRKAEETPLHIAVLFNDYKQLMTLREDEELMLSRNSLGFTALEIARLLDKRKCVQILQPENPRKIKVALKGEALLSEYSESEFEELFKTRYLPFQYFKDYAYLKEIIRQCPWAIKWSYFGRQNRSLSRRYQKELSSGYTPDMTIKWVHDEIGYGVYTNDELNLGDYIGEYTGNIRPLDSKAPNHNPYCMLYPTNYWSGNVLMVDALKGANILRFINHSDTPNLTPVCLVDRGILHLVFIAGASICKGTHLTVDYGKDYWLNREKISLSQEDIPR